MNMENKDYQKMFGMEACMESVKFEVETLGYNPFEMLGRYQVRAEQDKYFNKTMIEATMRYIRENGIKWDKEQPPIRKGMVEVLQNRVTHWCDTIRELAKEQVFAIENGNEFTKSQALNQYKGRVYAARGFEEILGIELDTDFTPKNHDNTFVYQANVESSALEAMKAKGTNSDKTIFETAQTKDYER